jgi:hypothetical protein
MYAGVYERVFVFKRTTSTLAHSVVEIAKN